VIILSVSGEPTVIINSSNLKAFKNKSLVLTNIEITYLNNILNIISIFVKTTTKL